MEPIRKKVDGQEFKVSWLVTGMQGIRGIEKMNLMAVLPLQPMLQKKAVHLPVLQNECFPGGTEMISLSTRVHGDFLPIRISFSPIL